MIFEALNAFVTASHEKNPEAPTLLAKPSCMDSLQEDEQVITYRQHVNNLEKLGFVFESKKR